MFCEKNAIILTCSTDPVTRNEPEECCKRAPNSRNPYCLQIDVPHDDPFYGVYGVRCIDFVRGFPGVRAGCRLGIVFFFLNQEIMYLIITYFFIITRFT